jgi:hypothetical protein
LELLLKDRNKNIVACRYKTSEKENADQGAELGPICFLLHNQIGFGK